jgi:hypothetical protein
MIHIDIENKKVVGSAKVSDIKKYGLIFASSMPKDGVQQ